MTDPVEAPFDPHEPALVEGFAVVVAINDGMVLLEPDQLSSCGSCGSAATCGVKDGQTPKLSKRFTLANTFHAQLGDRIVVGIAENALVRASAIAYGLPLIIMIVAGVAGQSVWNSDAGAALSALAGLALGLLLARLRAGQLTSRGELSPRYLRHAGTWERGEECHTD